MRRIAPFGLLLVLAGCGLTDHLPEVTLGNPTEDYVGNPLAGIPTLIADTHTPFRHPNRPDSDAPLVKQIEGKTVLADALLPEPGNVWPAPFQPDPSLSDIARSMDTPAAPSKQIRKGAPQ